MIEVTRRGAIGGAVAASAVGAIIPVQTCAAGPAASKQAAGFYHYNVGDIQVTVATDGARTFPLPDGFVANAKKEEINAALQAAYLPPDNVTGLFFAGCREHWRKARDHRHRLRPRRSDAAQQHVGPVPGQSCGGGHRP